MARRQNGAMDLWSLATVLVVGLFSYAAWLTSIVFCAANGMHALLISAAVFLPIGVVHGVGVWFGGW